MATKYKNESELLKLLNSRAAFNLPPYRKPVIDDGMARAMDLAARTHGEAHPSDPYAAARMKLYLYQGYELPSDVLQDARSRLARSAT